MTKCDIIIPIYNAYDCLQPCIDSIINNTDLKNNRIILIDDKSPDERVLPLLQKYSSENKNIILLKNNINLGFVKTVNKGMKYSKSDVLLLNSDTEVSKNWLEKIAKRAYSEPMVATVTPLSNNATLCSVPKGLQRNELPKNMNFNEYAYLIEKCAYDESFELPTAHGFCMYIKREALDLVGYFDDATFEKGYGEENDFCYRCMDYGYKNLLCPNTIIYHKESQSFSTKRDELIKEHSTILNKRYPFYTSNTGRWCNEFPIKKVCENVDYQINLHNRKNILILIHDWDIKNSGGTTFHVYDLVRNLRSKYNFHILAPSGGIYRLYSYFENEEKITNFDAIEKQNIIPTYSVKYRKMIEDIIVGYRIDTIHIHHMIGHYFDVIDVAQKYNLHTMITLHDFYSLCPTINMLYNMETCCIGMKNPDCKNCISHKTQITNNIIPLWRKEWQSFLGKFDEIIVPSNSTKKIINSYYNDLKITVIEHGIDIKKNDYYSNIDNNTKYNVAFVGVMAKHKGGDILNKLVTENENSNIVFHLFGTTEIKELQYNRHNYVYHGQYERNSINNLMKNNNINLVCLFSRWPETYSYTLTETLASGVPVLGFGLGAVKDRIIENKVGWIIPVTTDSKKIISKILDIFSDKDEYAKTIDNIKKYNIKTSKEMAIEYEKYYNKNSIIKLNDKNAEVLKEILTNANKIKNSVYDEEAQRIVNSLRWKIVSKIKVPQSLKNTIRRMMKNV